MLLKALKYIILTLTLAGLIWINLPENFPYLTPPFNLKTKYGLDLKGGTELIFEVDTSKVKKDDLDKAIESARDIIERRVNFLGVSEATINTLTGKDKYMIQVLLPGFEKPEQAINLIGKTAQLVFKELEEPPQQQATPSSQTLSFKNTDLTGKYIKNAFVSFNPQTGEPQVALEFNKEGAKLFEQITARNIGKPLAIFVDETLISAPIVNEKISGGQAVIAGNFSVKEAKQLAIAIRSGALPVPLKLVKQSQIGPTLGKVEVEKSFKAGIIGLLSVAFFMILYYGRFGVVAVIALVLYGLITLAIFRLIPVVLTLPGIAGFILSIGMAVDSNILISERIKEELRKGKPLDIAINLGFGRALDAIKDANFTTLAVAFILFNPLNWSFLPQFGLVRGFALTLGIGVLVSLFTGVFITRKILKLIVK